MNDAHDHRPFEPEAELFRALHARLQLSALLRRFPERPVLAAFTFVNGFVSIALLSAMAMLTGSPLVFPSLGPTAFLLFFQPTSITASPRHALLGHAIGLACGYGALWCTGLAHAPPATQMGVNAPRVIAAALSLSATGALLILLKVMHAPAGATTLIVSLGIITAPLHLLEIEVAVALLVAGAFAVNRFVGLPYPRWETPPPDQRAPRAPPARHFRG